MKIPASLLFFLLVCTFTYLANADAGDDPRDLIRDRMQRKLARNNRYGGEDDEAAMERIRNHDKLRLKRMEELIEQRTQQLKDHETGHRRLSDEDHERFNRQINAFKRKLEQVNSMSEEEYENSMRDMTRSIKQMNSLGMPDL